MINEIIYFFKKHILELILIFGILTILNDYFKWIKPVVPDEKLMPSELLYRKQNNWGLRFATIILGILLLYYHCR
jgi:hypothetical protein